MRLDIPNWVWAVIVGLAGAIALIVIESIALSGWE